MKTRSPGFTLIEIVFATAILGIFLFALVTLESEMRAWERRLPINFMKHPQIVSVLSRLRRDVQDVHIGASGKIYKEEHDGFTNGSKTLIIESLQESGEIQTIVWDFSKPGQVLRRSYDVGVSRDWVARGLPEWFDLEVEAVLFPGRPYGVRVLATDGKGKLAIDQILQPRAHF